MTVFLCALPQEARALRKLARPDRSVVILGGVGPRNAETATRRYIEQSGKPDLIVSSGVAGALSPELKLGAVVVASRVMDESSSEIFSCVAPAVTQAPLVTFLSVNRMITSAIEKRSLAEKHGADAVDMESAAVARVCSENGIAFVAIRAISDRADESLPAVVPQFYDNDMNLRPSRIAKSILMRPGVIGPLRRLQQQTNAACESLRRFLEQIDWQAFESAVKK